MRQHLLQASSAIILVALTSGASLAQETSPTPDVVVVTSGPLGLRADELVGSNDVVSQRELEDNLAGSLADTIAREPGVSTTFFGPAASRPVIRGLGADRVRVLANGVGLIDASTASPDHAVASEALEARRIEILRGPAAIAYGGGAIGGVVNVIDGRIPDEANDDFTGRFYGGYNTGNEGETAAGRIGFGVGALAFNLEMMTRNADDYRINGDAESQILQLFEEAEEGDDHDDHDDDDHDSEHGESGRVENSGLQFDTASLGVSWVADWGFIGLGVKQTDALYGIPGGHGHHEEEEDDDDHGDHGEDDDHDEHEEEVLPRIRLDQTRYDIRSELNFDSGWVERIKFSTGFGEYEHVELEGDEIGTVFDNQGWESRLETRFRGGEIWGGNWEAAAGFQAFDRDFSAIGEEAFVPPSVTEDRGLFFVERWDADSWGLEGGLRVEQRDLSANGTDLSFDTQSLSASIFVRPQADTFIALTLSSNERAPTDVELFADGAHLATGTYEVGDVGIRAEEAVSVELTARTAWLDWELEGAVFAAEYDGFIGNFPTGAEIDHLPVFAYRQVDAELQGFEIQASGPLGRMGDWDISSTLSTEYVSGSTVDGDLPNLPPLQVKGRLEAESGIHHAHVSVNWADVQNQTAPFEYKTPGYVLLGAGWTITPDWSRDVRFILEGRNLLDNEARLHTSVLKEAVPLPGRSLRLAMVLGF
ncbi:MAG: TonB-dependent receptor [Maricaulis sp.]|nr:TonB-dependent receptor [Maricaulis sp.]